MPDFSLLGNAPNVGQSFLAGYKQSQGMLQQEASRNALSAYAQDPSNPQAMNALAAADPEAALQYRGQQQAEQARMAKMQQEQAEQGMKTAGQLALQVAGLPEEQRAQAWDASIDQLAGSFPGAGQYKGKYSPDMLRYVLAQSGLGDEFARMSQDRYSFGPTGQPMMTPGYGQSSNAAPSSQAGPSVGTVDGNGNSFVGGDYRDPNNWRKGGAASQGAGGF